AAETARSPPKPLRAGPRHRHPHRQRLGHLGHRQPGRTTDTLNRHGVSLVAVFLVDHRIPEPPCPSSSDTPHLRQPALHRRADPVTGRSRFAAVTSLTGRNPSPPPPLPSNP